LAKCLHGLQKKTVKGKKLLGGQTPTICLFRTGRWVDVTQEKWTNQKKPKLKEISTKRSEVGFGQSKLRYGKCKSEEGDLRRCGMKRKEEDSLFPVRRERTDNFPREEKNPEIKKQSEKGIVTTTGALEPWGARGKIS